MDYPLKCGGNSLPRTFDKLVVDYHLRYGGNPLPRNFDKTLGDYCKQIGSNPLLASFCQDNRGLLEIYMSVIFYR